MEVSTQIKKYRNDMKLSQEELAEKVYVSRQTISNWETGKNYPDIHSLLLLSSIFNVSLDRLIKGDIEMMKEKIKETEAEKALLRYPNNFDVVRQSAMLHYLFGLMTHDETLLLRSIELLDRSILLLGQNTDPEISELTIEELMERKGYFYALYTVAQ